MWEAIPPNDGKLVVLHPHCGLRKRAHGAKQSSLPVGRDDLHSSPRPPTPSQGVMAHTLPLSAKCSEVDLRTPRKTLSSLHLERYSTVEGVAPFRCVRSWSRRSSGRSNSLSLPDMSRQRRGTAIGSRSVGRSVSSRLRLVTFSLHPRIRQINPSSNRNMTPRQTPLAV